MISIRNVEKFFNDHPEHDDAKNAVMKKAREVADKNGVILTRDAQECLGQFATQLFTEMRSDIKHIMMGIEDLKKSYPDYDVGIPLD
ncbi:hypothetical protein ACFL2B_00190 [Patescibacteria group bacterium]